MELSIKMIKMKNYKKVIQRNGNKVVVKKTYIKED